jgi:hypothetical protein
VSLLVNWRRQRKNRHGADVVTVTVTGKTAAGYLIIQRQRRGRVLTDLVHPRNIKAVHEGEQS